MSKIHEIKIIKPYSTLVFNGVKRFEVRKNDRNYKVGDTLYFKEIVMESTAYPIVLKHVETGQRAKFRINYILLGGAFGIETDYCVMDISPIDINIVPEQNVCHWVFKETGSENYHVEYYLSSCGEEFPYPKLDETAVCHKCKKPIQC